MMSPFEIQFSPRESAASDPLDRIAQADIGFFVGNQCLTELEDRFAKTVRPTFRASSYRLAMWLADNWWRLCYEPESSGLDWQMSHQLPAIAAGYIWPSLSMTSDGEIVTLRMRSSQPSPSQDIRYLADLDLQIPVGVFITGIDRFIIAVIERVRAMDHPDTDLERLWDEIQLERRDAETTHWRKLEALAGLDAGAAEGQFLDSLLLQQASVGPSSLEEWIAAYKDKTLATLNGLAEIRAQAATSLTLPGIEPLRAQIQEEAGKQRVWNILKDASSPSWQRAYWSADKAREFWGIQSGPVSNKQFADILGARDEAIFSASAAKARTWTAGFKGDGTRSFDVILGTQAPTGRRFALARLLGDYLSTADNEHVLPATTAKTARQKFQRAFAQQLLCPVEELKAFLNTDEPDDEAIEDAANAFQVSPLLVRSTLVNQGLLDRRNLQIAHPRYQ